ncbi:hydroxyacylglutathione hydrolase [Advenella kashmirensis W13003]|uniref:Hydroxyacylglutathione hydrolase n=1 Tax=Advenella kashmirensis W13003 TaxID=1424334 RepID=V8QRJ3_9BURK|nr:FAD/NAD(P)-binding protein [Advenella kashmirensis]ETF01594.1 hydroxyacylglutathione hydrolase [Advenella kashmirensis W13003]
MNKNHHLAIVGGGSVAVSFLAQFIARLQNTEMGTSRLRITLFEPTGIIGQGTAYQADLNTNLLNVPANNMSLYDENRGHFVNWISSLSEKELQGYGIERVDGNEFYPRPLFGRYVGDQFNRVVRQANALGVEVEVVHESIIAIEKQPNKNILLRDGSGHRYEADRIVLCNGNLSSDKFDALLPHTGFFNSPYPVNGLLETIPRDAAIGILGSNLSAIDAIVALMAGGHTGPIHCFSRQGKLPSVRSTRPTAVGNKMTRGAVLELVAQQGGHLKINHIFERLREMIQYHSSTVDFQDVRGQGENAKEQLDCEILASLSQERPWQSVLASTNEVIDLLWYYLAPPEKREFQDKWLSQWMSRRSMFPMKNALKIQSMMVKDQLHVHAGFQSCRPGAGKQYFDMDYRDKLDVIQSLRCDFVINATGFSQNVEKSTDPLVVNLLKSGLATPSEYGGLKLDFPTGGLLSSDGKLTEEITVLGSLARGTYFWTISMDVNARLANQQARQIIAKLAFQSESVKA